MNKRQIQAEKHRAELLNAKNELTNKVNQQIQSARSQGYTIQVAPQLLRLLGIKSYRKREVQNMNRLIDNSDKLSEYISVINPATGELVSGGEAAERYSRYQQSTIYHVVEPTDIPREQDIVFDNFSQMAEQSFTDDSVYKNFITLLDSVYYNSQTNAIDDATWSILHPSIDKTKKGKSKSQGAIVSSKRYWMQQNREHIADIHNAVMRLAELEGENEVAKRLSESGELIIDEMIVAAIGYNESSSRAVQTILNVLLPSGVRKHAMSMGEFIVDEADDFGDHE